MSTQNKQGIAVPSERLGRLGRLIGTWAISGGAEGTVRYRWMEGGFFLIQEVDLTQEGNTIKGIEIIGHYRPFNQAPSEAIVSRFYDNSGNTLDYEYELEDDRLVIWAGAKGSEAYFSGSFSADGDSNHGAWVFPGGYGYESVMVRQKDRDGRHE